MGLSLLSYTLEIIKKKGQVWSLGKTTELFMVNLPTALNRSFCSKNSLLIAVKCLSLQQARA